MRGWKSYQDFHSQIWVNWWTIVSFSQIWVNWWNIVLSPPVWSIFIRLHTQLRLNTFSKWIWKTQNESCMYTKIFSQGDYLSLVIGDNDNNLKGKIKKDTICSCSQRKSKQCGRCKLAPFSTKPSCFIYTRSTYIYVIYQWPDFCIRIWAHKSSKQCVHIVILYGIIGQSSGFVLKFDTPADMSTCKYFFSANNASLSSWKTNPSLENTLSGYNPTETVDRKLSKAQLVLLRWSH